MTLTEWRNVWMECKAGIPACGWLLVFRSQRRNLLISEFLKELPDIFQRPKKQHVSVDVQNSFYIG